jgi:hypothetical protein
MRSQTIHPKFHQFRNWLFSLQNIETKKNTLQKNFLVFTFLLLFFQVETKRRIIPDNLNILLNDTVWLLEQFSGIEKLPEEKERLEAIEKILKFTNPGPGGFYDNFDPNVEYMLRIAYTGRFRASIKLEADGVLIHDYIRMGSQPIYKFELAAEISRNGKVTFTWTAGTEDQGGGERGAQMAEI